MSVKSKIEGNLVGGTGFEPVTSSVSRKRSTPEPTARSLVNVPPQADFVKLAEACIVSLNVLVVYKQTLRPGSPSKKLGYAGAQCSVLCCQLRNYQPDLRAAAGTRIQRL